VKRRLLLIGVAGIIGIPAWGAGEPPGLPVPIARPAAGAAAAEPLNTVGRFLARHGGLVRRREYRIGSVKVQEPLIHGAETRAPALPAGTASEEASLVVSAVLLTAARPEGEETVYGLCLRKPETRRKLGACRYLDMDEGEALVAALPLLQQLSAAPAGGPGESAPCSFSTRSRLRFTLVQAGPQKAAALNCGDRLTPRVVLIRTEDLGRVSTLVQKALLKLREKGAITP
jgi:hypothetical protein